MQSLRICFVGDSFVNGAGDPECIGWAGRICAAASRAGHDITCYNLGVRRETSADIAARWRDEVVRRLPPGLDGRVVFSFGVNDTTVEEGLPRIAVEDSLGNARRILTEAARSYPVLMVGPPPVADAAQNERIARLSIALASVCRDADVPYLAVFDALAATRAWMTEAAAGDGAHPRAGGYEAFAALVEAWAPWRSWIDR